ncbi:hypothetical protein Pcinc_020337 [Petrolisthes cinctipes]|uniref:Uncharacterized protein n=1 Tax=Petrolisthes cinctipes TaxID=88211 RepID=A0AAE1FIB5_PETCI|nr:hypothetical protein Pcinc_020337 [Petrolisthes cinctipes]
MSSSCVPPKTPCVLHAPAEENNDSDEGGSSECGSLCTCTSGSLSSLTAPVSSMDTRDRLVVAAPNSSLSASFSSTHPTDRLIAAPTGVEGHESMRNFLSTPNSLPPNCFPSLPPDVG